MRCKNVERLLSRFVDDDLDASDQDAVERHLAVCTVCAARYDEIVRMGRRLHAAGDAIPEMRCDADAYWASLQEKLGAPQRPLLFHDIPWRATVPAVGVAAAIFFGVLIWYPSGAAAHASPSQPTALADRESETDPTQQTASPPTRPERTAPRDNHSGLSVMPASPDAQWAPPSERAGDDSETIWF